jgi:hypothetical protein
MQRQRYSISGTAAHHRAGAAAGCCIRSVQWTCCHNKMRCKPVEPAAKLCSSSCRLLPSGVAQPQAARPCPSSDAARAHPPGGRRHRLLPAMVCAGQAQHAALLCGQRGAGNAALGAGGAAAWQAGRDVSDSLLLQAGRGWGGGRGAE